MIDYKLVENCIFCEQSFKDVYRTKEHIIPKKRIPFNNVKNYTSSCVWCNTIKGNRDAKEFAIFLEKVIREEDERYNYVSHLLKTMKDNSWKLYNKTHKSHNGYFAFFEGYNPKNTTRGLNSIGSNCKNLENIIKSLK